MCFGIWAYVHAFVSYRVATSMFTGAHWWFGVFVWLLASRILVVFKVGGQCWLFFFRIVPANAATLSGLEPSLQSPVVGKQGEIEGPKMGLVLGGGLPSIPVDLLQRVQKGQYVELTEFLLERIQESFLFPEGKKKKLQPIDQFLDWVLAFCTYSQALASGSSSPTLACDLLTFVGTVARLARDHPGSAWASYEHAARAKAVANPHFQWEKLDQELWALATVRGSAGPSSYPHQGGGRSGKRARIDTNACFKWNDGTCNFKKLQVQPCVLFLLRTPPQGWLLPLCS